MAHWTLNALLRSRLLPPAIFLLSYVLFSLTNIPLPGPSNALQVEDVSAAALQFLHVQSSPRHHMSSALLPSKGFLSTLAKWHRLPTRVEMAVRDATETRDHDAAGVKRVVSTTRHTLVI